MPCPPHTHTILRQQGFFFFSNAKLAVSSLNLQCAHGHTDNTTGIIRSVFLSVISEELYGHLFVWTRERVYPWKVYVTLNLTICGSCLCVPIWLNYDSARRALKYLNFPPCCSSTFWTCWWALPNQQPNYENLPPVYFSKKMACTCSFHLEQYLVPHISASTPPFSSPFHII